MTRDEPPKTAGDCASGDDWVARVYGFTLRDPLRTRIVDRNYPFPTVRAASSMLQSPDRPLNNFVSSSQIPTASNSYCVPLLCDLPTVAYLISSPPLRNRIQPYIEF